MAGSVLIVGCGYVGQPLARELAARGWRVDGWVRSAEGARRLAEGTGGHTFRRVVSGSVADGAIWRGLGAAYDAVVQAAATGGGAAAAYREVYLEGARQVAAHQPAARRLFVSSTSVYAQADGGWVTEDSPAEPAGETGKILRQAEETALAAGATVVRSAGIYGPGRAVLWEKFRRGMAVIEGDGGRWLNMIHRDDLVAALVHLLERGGGSGAIYNAADDGPVAQRDFYGWCAARLSRPLPPSGEAGPDRKRGRTSKRVSNAKLKAAGWAPRFPTFREGLGALPAGESYSPR